MCVVQGDVELRAIGLNQVRVPQTDWLDWKGSGCLERVDRTRAMDVRPVRRSHIVDLDFVALVHGRLQWIGGPGTWRADEDTRVITGVGLAPFKPELEVGELFLDIEVEAVASRRLENCSKSKHLGLAPGLRDELPISRIQRKWAEANLRRRCNSRRDDRFGCPPRQAQRGERRIGGTQAWKDGRTGGVGIGDAVEFPVRVADRRARTACIERPRLMVRRTKSVAPKSTRLRIDWRWVLLPGIDLAI